MNAITDARGVLLDARDGVVGASGVDELAFDPVGVDWIRVITRLAFRVDSHAPTSVRVLLRRGGRSYEMYRVLAPTAGAGYALSDPLILAEGVSLIVQVVGGTAGDAIYAAMNGYDIDMVQRRAWRELQSRQAVE